jgi:hypothetical protein
MRKQLVIIGILALFLCICFSGCEGFHSFDFLNSDYDKLCGIWGTDYRAPDYLPPHYYVNYSTGYQIYGNGKIRNFYGLNGTWELKNGKLIIIYDDPYYDILSINNTYTYEYSFPFLQDDVLNLLKVPSENQTPVVYKKWKNT